MAEEKSILDLVADFNGQCLEAARQEGVARRKARRSGCRTWPMESNLGVGCHPSQVAEFRERNRKLGIAVDYKPDGTAVISGPAAYKQLLRAQKMYNADSYGGVY